MQHGSSPRRPSSFDQLLPKLVEGNLKGNSNSSARGAWLGFPSLAFPDTQTARLVRFSESGEKYRFITT
jgi:hypothetical protein